MISRRFLRTIRHTPASQLFHRAALMGKRRAFCRLAARFESLRAPSSAPPPALQEDLPAPFLPCAHGSVTAQPGRYAFTFLNETREYALPIDWHDEALNTGTRLWKLNLHYFDYAHQLDDPAFTALVSDWIEQNRPYGPGYWLDSWNSYAMSIRLVAWMGEFQRRQGTLDAPFKDRLAASIAEQARFLLANLELDIGGNHIIKNIRALLWCARFLDTPLGARAGQTGISLLERELERQILADGFHCELSPAYHNQVFGDLLDCWRLMAPGAVRDRLLVRLEAMAQIVADFTHPDSQVSLFNDGGLNMTVPASALLRTYEEITEKTVTARAVSHYTSAGYHVLRTPDFLLVYDAGRLGPDGLPAHAHGDVFAFELSAGGRRLIVDTGVYEYNPGSRRDHARATVAHNTLTLDDEDQGEFWSAFRLGRRPDVSVHRADTENGVLIVDAGHSGFRHLPGNPVHRRTLTASRDGIISVRDIVTGGDGQRALARLLLHPDVSIEREADGRLRLKSGAIECHLEAGGAKVRIENQPWWPDFGVEIATRQLVLDYGVVPGEWGFALRVVTGASASEAAPDGKPG